MKVIDCFEPVAATAVFSARTWNDGCSSEDDYALQTEHHLEVRVEGRVPVTLVCSPEYLLELTLGHLFAEGLIGGVDEVRLLHLNRPGTVATVVLRTEGMGEKGEGLLDVVPDAAPFAGWDLSWVRALADRFCADTPMHRKTHGAHSCFIAMDGAVVFECEDIGRHNAFDKVLGHALRRGIDLSRTMVFTSGRTPSDVIAKAARAGIPVLVSAAVPTDQAVALAQEKGVTLFSWARSKSFRLFSDPLGRGAELLRTAGEGTGSTCENRAARGKIVGAIGDGRAVCSAVSGLCAQR